MATIVIGTRGSELALWQADYVGKRLQNIFPDITIERKILTTQGDKILDAPLAKIGGKGLFTKELEEAMSAGRIDLAVHSLKDMPAQLPAGLTVAAVTEREHPFDALVSVKANAWDSLPQGATVGTSSLRRRAQLLHRRPDLNVVNLRGNVNTRLKKLAAGEFDAIILAAAGLYRLKQENYITQILPEEIMVPAVGQGALAIEARADDEITLRLAALNHEPTAFAAKLERSFLRVIEGGCQVPVGVYACMRENNLTATAVIASLDGKKYLRRQIEGNPQQAAKLGEELAKDMLVDGGHEILREIGL